MTSPQQHIRLRNDFSNSPRASRGRSASPTRSSDLSTSASSQPGTGREAQARNTVPACERCRSFKKKCSRTFPVCTLCASAGQKCSYSTPPATPEAEALQLRARVQWLSSYINDHVLTSNQVRRVENIETGSDLAALFGTRRNMNVSSPTSEGSRHTGKQTSASTPPAPESQLDDDTIPIHDVPVHSGPDNTSVNTSMHITASDTHYNNVPNDGRISNQGGSGQESDPNLGNNGPQNNLPEGAAARRFVDAYFRNVNRAYPFVNQTKILKNLETLGDLAQGLRDSQSTLLYLIMSIGCTTLERAGEVPRDTSKRFEVAYAEIIQECVCQNSIDSVQILMLLALYSLFDPTGPSVYSVVGIAARQAVTIGLTRGSIQKNSYTSAESELRHRLYWSIFALDRMMSVSQGLPTALEDKSSVPFPSLTVEEFASIERATYARKLQTSRHVIQLRHLEGRILEQVHLRQHEEVAAMAPLDRRSILSGFRSSIEDWYSQGCLMSPMGSGDRTVHSSTTWLSARYYHLLLLLYYPNYFNFSAKAVSRHELLQFAQRQLQATSVLFQQRQLPLNCNTLFRLMPVCMVLMHDFVASCRSTDWTAAQSNNQAAFPFQARDEVAVMLSVLEAFPKGWELAHQAAQVTRQFSGVVSGGVAAFYAADTVFPLGPSPGNASSSASVTNPGEACGTMENLPALIEACIERLASVMQQMLGTSTCFQYVEYPQDDARIGGSMQLPTQSSLQAYQSQPVHGSLMSQMTTQGTGVEEIQSADVADDEMVGYGWGALDLDFL